MKKNGLILVLIMLCSCLTACIGGLWTGASLVYDRHNVYKKISDYQLFVEVNNLLSSDKLFKSEGCALDIATFNGDVLVSGHLNSAELLATARQRLSTIHGYRNLYNEIALLNAPSNSAQDSWITAKIRGAIFADDSIDPNAFKVVTSDRIVYLMGDVKPEQTEKVINIARRVVGVERVVKLMKYFTYQSSKMWPDKIRPSGASPVQEVANLKG